MNFEEAKCFSTYVEDFMRKISRKTGKQINNNKSINNNNSENNNLSC